MARGKHGWNNTIESRLLIKGGNLAKLVPARRAASANPDMSTSDLHHSSPQARINRPLTPCKSLPMKTPVIWQDTGREKLYSDTHTHIHKHADTHRLYPPAHTRGYTHTCANNQTLLLRPCSALKGATVTVTPNQ